MPADNTDTRSDAQPADLRRIKRLARAFERGANPDGALLRWCLSEATERLERGSYSKKYMVAVLDGTAVSMENPARRACRKMARIAGVRSGTMKRLITAAFEGASS